MVWSSSNVQPVDPAVSHYQSDNVLLPDHHYSTLPGVQASPQEALDDLYTSIWPDDFPDVDAPQAGSSCSGLDTQSRSPSNDYAIETCQLPKYTTGYYDKAHKYILDTSHDASYADKADSHVTYIEKLEMPSRRTPTVCKTHPNYPPEVKLMIGSLTRDHDVSKSTVYRRVADRYEKGETIDVDRLKKEILDEWMINKSARKGRKKKSAIQSS